jgi:ABC-type nitrate/sulfonate/bicarbonate transport system substrate-binding protein
VRIVAVYPSWDRFVFMVHPRTGIRSLADLKAKRYPLRVSVREDPTHSTHVLIEQAFALHGLTLKDIESWGGRLVLCGGPSDLRRLEPMARGEVDAVLDEGIKVWLDQALAAGLVPIEPIRPNSTR